MSAFVRCKGWSSCLVTYIVPDMLIEVALTKDIINESLPVHYRHTSFNLRFLPFIVCGILLLIAGANAWLGIKDGKVTESFLTIGIFGIILLCIGFYVQYRRTHAGSQMIKALGDRINYEIEVNEEQLTTRLSDATYVQMWTVYPKAIISKNLILLYQQNNSFAMFHHSFFANDDFSRFRQLVRTRVHQVIED